jgi:hypothetical protein
MEWVPEAAAMLAGRPGRAAAWRLRPAPGSGYPAVRALTEARLFRRLAI